MDTTACVLATLTPPPPPSPPNLRSSHSSWVKLQISSGTSFSMFVGSDLHRKNNAKDAHTWEECADGVRPAALHTDGRQREDGRKQRYGRKEGGVEWRDRGGIEEG